MNLLGDFLLSGLAVGAIYGLVAMGFAVIYKATGLVNFAQGEMTMLCAYVAWTISTTFSGNPFVVALASLVFAILLGLSGFMYMRAQAQKVDHNNVNHEWNEESNSVVPTTDAKDTTPEVTR